MTLQEAIKVRHSVRKYINQPLADDVVAVLHEKIEEVNRKGNLHVQLVLNEPRAYCGVLAYGKFCGVTNYLVMAGQKADNLTDRVGYYGEQLVLLAQTLGLNTCWTGLTYKKVADTYSLNDGEKIVCYIALGYGETQGVTHKSKTISDVSNANDSTPEWFCAGVEAALLAPTAVNQQKFRFEYLGENRVRATRQFSLIGYTQLDLGIARLHFEIGAEREVEWIY